MNKQEIICHTPNISIPHSALIGKKNFPNTKGNTIQKIYLLQNKIYIALLASVTARLHSLTYLPSLAVCQKYHVMFDMELNVQMEGIFNILEKFIKCLQTCYHSVSCFLGRDYFKCFDVS
jgi:hypothetical protein